MVLHNNKWDKKAKRTYMRRHGIKPEPRPEDEGHTNDNGAALQGNLWRYQKEEEEEDQSGSDESGIESSEKGESQGELQRELQGEIQGELQGESESVVNEGGGSEDSEVSSQMQSLDFFPQEENELPYEQEYRKNYLELARKAAEKNMSSSNSGSDRVIKVSESDADEFKQLQIDVEQSRIRDSVKRRFQVKSNVPFNIQEEEFDEFIQQVDEKSKLSAQNSSQFEHNEKTSGAPILDSAKQKFLDQLIGI